MPTGNSSLHARALRRALAHEAVILTWGAVTFAAIKNALPVAPDRVDENAGDSTACELTALVTADPDAERTALDEANLPGQGDVFTDTAGLSYRVGSFRRVPGLPAIIFRIPAVTTP